MKFSVLVDRGGSLQTRGNKILTAPELKDVAGWTPCINVSSNGQFHSDVEWMDLAAGDFYEHEDGSQVELNMALSNVGGRETAENLFTDASKNRV